MFKSLRHITEQPFIAATGAAALVHSTWALATLFAGEQPDGTLSLIGWLAPALLIAFAMDVGQIVTSHEIRKYGLTRSRGWTFGVFAVFTYYLQWLYIAHHMPALELAPGVAATWKGAATALRDAAVWIIPALLPLSTLLYTFSGDNPAVQMADSALPIQPIEVKAPDAPTLPENAELAPLLHTGEITPMDGTVTVSCAACGEWSKVYSTPEKAQRGLRTHQSMHCTAMHPVSANGNGAHIEITEI